MGLTRSGLNQPSPLVRRANPRLVPDWIPRFDGLDQRRLRKKRWRLPIA